MSRYVVLCTKNKWAVFRAEAYDYPDAFWDGINEGNVYAIREIELKKWLIQHVGLNNLQRVNFDFVFSVGKVYMK